MTNVIPDDSCPITVTTSCEYNINLGYIYESEKVPLTRSWQDHLKTLHPFHSQLIAHHTILKDDLIYTLQDPKSNIIIYSDGSVYTTTSGGAWLIVINGEIAVVGINGDTGVQEYQNSYRSKAHSLLSGLKLLHELEKFMV